MNPWLTSVYKTYWGLGYEVGHPVHSNGDWRKSVRYTGYEALVRYFQYQDNNNLLDSDEEENLDDQLMGYNSDSGEDSSHDNDETARFPPDDDQQQQTQSIQLTSRYVQRKSRNIIPIGAISRVIYIESINYVRH